MTKQEYDRKKLSIVQKIVGAKLDVLKHPNSEHHHARLIELEDELVELENDYKYSGWQSD